MPPYSAGDGNFNVRAAERQRSGNGSGR